MQLVRKPKIANLLFESIGNYNIACLLNFTGGTSINIPNDDCCAVAPDGLSDAFLRDGVKCRRFVSFDLFVEPFIEV